MVYSERVCIIASTWLSGIGRHLLVFPNHRRRSK